MNNDLRVRILTIMSTGAFLFSMFNMIHNHLQDKMILETEDQMVTTTNQIHGILEIENTNQQAIITILKVLNK